MQPVESNADLDRAEAGQDGTALIGDIDPERTDRVETGNLPVQGNPDIEEVGQDWHRISNRITELFTAGVAENDPRTLEAIGEHYRWICHFWTPDHESYIRLARMYVSQPKFRKRIERRKPAGLAVYLRDAMTAYAWAYLQPSHR
ncbi:TipAS antibiotic-recognition protein [Halopolyspora algeriensis]|uniref:TipAS antibiotic-recognition protein n=1 Tax=Halopolyspora algeriensis TaxID=1500506 RepID=A0A368VT86_9ACTN|nr:TipAS antibiotic-recognition domain-containing protein [Halopolyspora algeriensis]RCW45200.1 TipAS antibiotic-recognition protein [Halopolyspora algeriensis]